MITKDVQAYAISNWGDFLSPITELSKSDKGVSLVQSPVQLYILMAYANRCLHKEKPLLLLTV